MAAVAESVGLDVGDVWIDNGDGDIALALVVGLDVEACWDFRDAAVDEFTGLDGARAKGKADVDNGVDGGQNVGHDVHLGDALHEDEAVILAPLLVGKVAVDGFVHVACKSSVSFMANSDTSSGHTLAIFKPPLDHGVVDVGVDLELFQVALHALDAVLVPLLILGLDSNRFQSLDSLCFRLNVVDLFLAVLDEDFACFLETLEGQLVEGDLRR